jgi:hypothetical protein
MQGRDTERRLEQRDAQRRPARDLQALRRQDVDAALRAAVPLHFANYNFVRVHRSLRVTPAMEARASDRLWSLDELAERTSE